VTAKKKVQDRGAQIPRNAAYLLVREIPRDAAQQRYWTFCEAVNLNLKEVAPGSAFSLTLEMTIILVLKNPMAT